MFVCLFDFSGAFFGFTFKFCFGWFAKVEDGSEGVGKMSGIEIHDMKSTKNKLKFKNPQTSENVDRESFFYCLENRGVAMRTLLGSTGLGEGEK